VIVTNSPFSLLSHNQYSVTALLAFGYAVQSFFNALEIEAHCPQRMPQMSLQKEKGQEEVSIG
jgi:hypothetical protein